METYVGSAGAVAGLGPRQEQRDIIDCKVRFGWRDVEGCHWTPWCCPFAISCNGRMSREFVMLLLTII